MRETSKKSGTVACVVLGMLGILAVPEFEVLAWPLFRRRFVVP